ncbi:782_t:CDS:1, partial [Funneliformis mosseae]
ILAELCNLKQVILNLDFDLTIKSEELSNVCFQCKYFKEMIKAQEKNKKETINILEKTIKERDEE